MTLEEFAKAFNISIEWRNGEISQELREVSETLAKPLEKKEIWIGYGEDELAYNKYGDYYPEIGILIKTEDAVNRNVIRAYPWAEKHNSVQREDDSCADLFQASKHEEKGNNFLGDIIEDIEAGYEEEVHSRITDAIINQSNELENFIKKSISDIVAESTRFCDPPFINKLPEHAYKILTSANYHNRLHTLYAVPMNDHDYMASQSFLRFKEVINLLIGTKAPVFNNTENLAIVSDGYIVYFHMDNGTTFAHDTIKINKYLYNDISKGILPVYDANDGMALVPYEKMGEVFDDKPILVFTYREHKFSFMSDVVFCAFEGEFAVSATDESGNFLLTLADMKYNLPI